MLTVALPVVLLAFSEYLSVNMTGSLATSLSVLAYAVSLDGISMTLKTRNSQTVNLAIVGGNFLNGLVWALYALTLRDIFVLIPNIVGLTSASIQMNLYHWTTGKIQNTHWLIKMLQYYFNQGGNKNLKIKGSSPVDSNESDSDEEVETGETAEEKALNKLSQSITKDKKEM